MFVRPILASETGASELTRRITVPVVLLLIVGLVALGFAMVSAALGRDEVAANGSRRTVAAAMRVVQDHLGRTVRDYAVWDEAMHNLVLAFDSAWAEDNVGRYVLSDYGIDHVLVVAADDTVVFAYDDGARSAPPALAGLHSSLRNLVAAARAAGPNDTAATGTVFHRDHVQVAAAVAVNWFERSKQVSAAQASVLVFGRGLDQALLAELADQYQVSTLRLDHPDAPPAAGELTAAVTGFGTDVVLARLHWRAELPGTAFLRDSAMPMSAAVLAIVVLLARILSSAQRAGRALDAATAELRASREQLETHVAERTNALRAAEARWRGLFENAAEGIFQTTPDGRLISANPAMARMLGYDSADDLAGQSVGFRLASGERRERLLRDLARDGVVRDFVGEVHRRDGSSIWTSQNTRAVFDDDGRAILFEGMVVDITARREAEERLIHEALHDPLTGLPNRSLFAHRLEEAIARHRGGASPGFALLFIDCDRFKLINDSLGHIAGDRLLITLGERIASCLRPGDVLARLGGDEFAVLVEGIEGTEVAAAVADRVHRACRRPIELDDRQVFMTVSIGLTAASEDYGSAREMLRDADTAMFRAKAKAAGSTAVFEAGMHLHVVSRLKLETELRQALAGGELCVHYQPIWPITGSFIAGFEALVRWRHPERGLVPPGEFIPVAEETGLIVPIGEWVLREACRQIAAWRRWSAPGGDGLFVAVNLSPQQLEQPDVVERVAAVVEDAGIPTRRLKLEVTESAMMRDPADALAKLEALHRLGVRLCIDDFGTGFSSLNQLHTYPFETLKIDRSFIARIATGRETLEMVRTIVLLGRNLGLSVVAEGVETPLQRDWLQAAGCAYAQGHLFSPAVDAEAADDLLRRQRPKPWLVAVGER